jgi:hypothetical protein
MGNNFCFQGDFPLIPITAKEREKRQTSKILNHAINQKVLKNSNDTSIHHIHSFTLERGGKRAIEDIARSSFVVVIW